MRATNKNTRAYYKRTLKRSNTIASTLFVLLSALLIFLVITGWDSIAPILRALGVIT